MNDMCGINLSGLRPLWGCRMVLFAIIAHCTMLLTGAPLELNDAETRNNDEGSMSLVADQKSRVIAHFYNV
jgi:hypothetical protein